MRQEYKTVYIYFWGSDVDRVMYYFLTTNLGLEQWIHNHFLDGLREVYSIEDLGNVFRAVYKYKSNGKADSSVITHAYHSFEPGPPRAIAEEDMEKLFPVYNVICQ